MNEDFADVGSALTASLARDGQGGMTAVLPLAASGFTYTIDPDTGMRRSAANEQTIFCGGTDVVKITSSGVFDAVTGASLGFVVGVPYQWPFSVVPTGCVLLYNQACTSAYPVVRAMLIASGSPYGTSGGDPLFPDYRGVTPVGKSDMGGVDRGILTGGTVLGALLGAQSVTLDTTMIPAHSHTASATTNGQSVGHTHSVTGTTSNESVSHTHTAGGETGFMSGNDTHSHNSVVADNTGGQVSGGNTQGGVWLGGPGSNTRATSTTSTQHVHDFNLTTAGNNQGHTHTLTTTSGGVSGDHTHTLSLTTANAGGGLGHANVQPSIVQNYIMRVA